MKKILFLLPLLFLINLTVCSAKVYYTYKMTSPVLSEALFYEDDSIIAYFNISRENVKTIGIIIHNKTTDAIELDWNKVSLTAIGKAFSVAPSSSLIIDARSNREISSVFIPPNSSITEEIVIKDSIYFNNDPMIFGGQKWDVRPLFPTSKSELEKTGMTGGKFGVFIPLVINEKRKNYNFVFDIINIKYNTTPGMLGIIGADKNTKQLSNVPIEIEDGVIILNIIKGSAAEKAGLKPMDVITLIDNTPIRNVDDFNSIINRKNQNDTINITYLNNGLEKRTTAKLTKYKN